MAKITLDGDMDLSVIKSKAIGVIGYGSQGHAHARNLKDSGLDVRVGLHAGSKSRAKAEEDGLEVLSVADLTKLCDVLMFCTPDVPMSKIYEADVKPHLRAGQALLFAHGLNIHFGLIAPPEDVDVAMVAPKGPGHRLRAEYEAGNGMPALIAVAQDATGEAKSVALGYAWGIGSGRAGILETTFKEETETDLFGEQAVLCGGLAALITAGFETLVEAGYQPEAAYFECLHETKLIVDLLYQGGLSYMRYSISETAEWGDYTAGPRIVGAETKAQMKALLTEIQDGTFVRRWIAENDAGLPEMTRHREEGRRHPIEAVGRELRGLMPFLEAKDVPAGA